MKTTPVNCGDMTDKEDTYVVASSILSPVLQNAVIYQSFSPYTEVSGRMITKMLEACGSFRPQFHSILNQFGISQVQSECWYPEQEFLNALNQAVSETGPVLLNQMGTGLADLLYCMPGMTIEESILLLNQYFHRWHRGEAGDYLLMESVPAAPSILVQCWHPYPCSMDMGLLKRLVQRVSGKQQVMVYHDHRQRQNCRKSGAGACNLMVCW